MRNPPLTEHRHREPGRADCCPICLRKERDDLRIEWEAMGRDNETKHAEIIWLRADLEDALRALASARLRERELGAQIATNGAVLAQAEQECRDRERDWALAERTNESLRKDIAQYRQCNEETVNALAEAMGGPETTPEYDQAFEHPAWANRAASVIIRQRLEIRRLHRMLSEFTTSLAQIADNEKAPDCCRNMATVVQTNVAEVSQEYITPAS